MGGKLRPPQPADGVRGQTALPAGPLGSLVSPRGLLGLCLSSRGTEVREGRRKERREEGRQGEEEGQGRGEGGRGSWERLPEAESNRRERVRCIEEEAREKSPEEQERENELDTQRQNGE